MVTMVPSRRDHLHFMCRCPYAACHGNAQLHVSLTSKRAPQCCGGARSPSHYEARLRAPGAQAAQNERGGALAAPLSPHFVHTLRTATPLFYQYPLHPLFCAQLPAQRTRGPGLKPGFCTMEGRFFGPTARAATPAAAAPAMPRCGVSAQRQGDITSLPMVAEVDGAA